MEKKFYTDDFEQFLKETADEFRMYPSKRVWNSLYNNLHPGRKWPSLAVMLLLISSVIFIGISHKNEITGIANYSKNNEHFKNSLTAKTGNKENVGMNSTETSSHLIIAQAQADPIVSAGTTQDNVNRSNDLNSSTGISGNHPVIGSNNDINDQMAAVVKNKKNRRVIKEKESASFKASQVIAEDDGNTSGIKNDLTGLQKNLSAVSLSATQKEIALSLVEKSNATVILPQIPNSGKKNINAEKEWIEDYAFHNQPNPPLKTKLQYQFYITPSIGYRTLKQTVSYNATATRPSLVTTNVPDGLNALDQNAGFNFEMGFTYVYANSKSTHLKAGVQMNFTNYRIHAHELGHSTNTNLVSRDPYSSNGVLLTQRSTSIANLYGDENDKNLNNNTVQISLPLGADFKFAGRHNLQWFVGATLQPTYVLFGNAYLISADHHNYVYDAKFLRKWNLNAGVEAFVSYKTKKGVTFNAGPQFRYQFFSSYKEKYSFDEKLYNVGIKLGMTRNF